jgi:hypothetical protein
MGTEVLHLDAQILEGAYRSLTNSKAGFDQAKDVAEDVRGAIGQPDDVARKVTDFADSWSVNRDRLSKSVGKLAEKLKGIIDSFDELDVQYGQAFSDATDKAKADNSSSTGGGGGSAGGHPSSSGSSGSAGGGNSAGTAASGGSTHPTADAVGGHTAAGGAPESPQPASPGGGPEAGAGPVAPVPATSSGSVPAGVAGAGGVALGVGSAAAVGSLFRAWSGRSTASPSATPGASSRAALADELRGMRRASPGAGTSSLSRSSVASLMKDGRSSGFMPMGMGGGAQSRAERERRGKHQRTVPDAVETPPDAPAEVGERPIDRTPAGRPEPESPAEETR